MVGIILCICSQFQKLCLLHADRMDFTDCKGAFCQCASLVKDNHLSMCQSFQVVASLYKNADLGCTANAAEETKRNGDDQRTRTGDNQESQGTVNPGAKRLPGNEWRQDCQRQGSKYHHRGVISGEARDKILDPAFFVTCIFHKVKDFCYGGFSKFLCGLDGQNSGLIDTAADNLHSRFHLAGHGLASEGRSVQCRKSFDDLTVQRDAFSRLYNNGISNLNLIRVNLNQFPVFFDVGIVRADIHEACN